MERRQRFEAYIAKWQDKLRLAWDIYFSDKDPPHSRIAEVAYVEEAVAADISVSRAVPLEYEEAQVLHEV